MLMVKKVNLCYIQFKTFVLVIVHVYVRSDGLASAVVSDSEYPQRVAYNLLSKVSIRFLFISFHTWFLFNI